jgi:8-oxo-dGTP pyrophosphatase MutT (NUDIX family)
MKDIDEHSLLPGDEMIQTTIRQLRQWAPPDRDQARQQVMFLDFLTSRTDGHLRSCPEGHLIGSAMVLDPRARKVLLQLHPLVGLWIELGGHCEPGDQSTADTAQREIQEESGLTNIAVCPVPIELEAFPDDCPRGVPNRHYAVRYAAVADSTETVTITDESEDLRWFEVNALPRRLGLGVRRYILRSLIALDIPVQELPAIPSTPSA